MKVRFKKDRLIPLGRVLGVQRKGTDEALLLEERNAAWSSSKLTKKKKE